MTMYAGLVLGGLFFAIVFCTVITIEDIKEIYNEQMMRTAQTCST